ncbi:MAG TPA: TIM barrel protein [Acidobacteriaceae bacterium]|jgi:hydroxypyruvate isomerase
MDCVAPMTRRQFARRAAAGLAGVAVCSRGVRAVPEKAARPFKLSVMLWTLRPKYTAEQAIDLVASAGYDGFELVDEDKKWSAADVMRIRARMAQLGIVCDAMSGIATGFADLGAGDLLAGELTARMTEAERMGCRRVILLSGKRDNSISREKQHEVCVENLQRAGEVAAKRGFDLLLEPIDALENPSIYLTHVEEAFDIVRAVNLSSVQVLYDFYHEARGGDGLRDLTSSLLSPLKGNMDLLGLVHVANVPGRCTPLTGEIRYLEIYAALRKEGYAGWLAMEFLPVGDAKAELQQAAARIL